MTKLFFNARVRVLLQIVFLDEIKLQLACQEGVFARNTLVRVSFTTCGGRVLRLCKFVLISVERTPTATRPSIQL